MSDPNKPSFDEQLSESKRIYEAIERIKERDPEGWQKTKIEYIKNWVLDFPANRNVAKHEQGSQTKLKQPDALKIYDQAVKIFKPQMEGLNDLTAIQNFMNDHHVPEIPELDSAALSIYEDNNDT